MEPSGKANASQRQPKERRWFPWSSRKKIASSVRLSSSKRSLWLSASLCITLAGVFYLIDFYLIFYKLEVWAGIARHLSTAFIVASVSIIGIEYNAKRRAERELADFISEFERYRTLISENVFEAVLGKIVPNEIIQEINEMLRNPFVKLSPEYIIRFFGPYEDMSQEYCVVRRDLYFRVKNVSAEPATFPVHSAYTSDENLMSAKWGDRPFHLMLTVNGEEIPSETFLTRDSKLVMHHEVEIGPKQEAAIFIQSEEPMRLEANRSFYYQSTPVDNMQVVIENHYEDIIGEVDVQMHHPGRNQVEHDSHRHRYVLKRAFFPGQGFEAIWRKSEGSRVNLERMAAARQMELLESGKDSD
jgi:hypothetical protein